MPGLAADQDAVSLVRRVSRALNRRLSDLVGLLFHHKSAGSLGAVAGFAIAVVFAWKFLRSSPARPRRPPGPKRPLVGPAAPDSDARDAAEPANTGKLTTRQIVVKRLGGCRKVTCQLLGVVFEEITPQELQTHATVRPSVVELLLEIAKYSDLYLMETVLDDKSEENALLALESAGLFKTGCLMKEKRFIRCQLFVSSIEGGQLAGNAPSPYLNVVGATAAVNSDELAAHCNSKLGCRGPGRRGAIG
uniref:Peroxisome biogenesis protein 22 n=1 Tax=Oryza meridionalis TaxID=40149 RepID=A0A0E0DK07_9ORYZ